MGRGSCGQRPPPACQAVPGRWLRPGFGSWPLRSSRSVGSTGELRGQAGALAKAGTEVTDTGLQAEHITAPGRREGAVKEIGAGATFREQRSWQRKQEQTGSCAGAVGGGGGSLTGRGPGGCWRRAAPTATQPACWFRRKLHKGRLEVGSDGQHRPPAPVSGGRERGFGLRSALGCKLVSMPLFLSRVTAAERGGTSTGVSSQPCAQPFPENAASTGFGGRMNGVSPEQGGGPPGPPALGLAALRVVWGPPARLSSAAGQSSVLPLGQQGRTAQGPL